MNSIYLDNAATTALRPEVVTRMTQVLNETYGNASSSHSFGRASKALLEQCRKNIASYFNVSASEIVFTAGGTESDNLALRSAVRDLGVTEIITSQIEHHAVLHTLDQLQKEYGVKVTYVKLKADGSIDEEDLESVLGHSDGKKLVTLMHVNNEIGNVLNLKSIAKIVKSYGALFHSDTVQSVGHYKIDLKEIPIDFTAASAHKFHGPKGVGFCFVRKESGLKPLIFGGEQERGHRAGTESLHNIAGMDAALKIAYANLEEEHAYVLDLKNYFITELQNNIPNVSFNGCSKSEESTYTLVSVRLPMAPGKASMLQFQLDLKGIASSRGSACQSGSSQQSHVLKAILPNDELAKPSIRFSFSIYNTKEELDYVVGVLKALVNS
ncbi:MULTISPECIES: cysteine desulfurase family protein [Winogradskyella]|uniref:cysteine desulfurase family protein n=1 Tax=Winogradskyella TaxID=286104 RepID=UPI0015C70D59|nr:MULTISPECIES: cysteine desulfurase family protein [Winogradskyella]QXP78559.1 cysteine desulfurase [Winogradskyella sp. HaHa_3_26]